MSRLGNLRKLAVLPLLLAGFMGCLHSKTRLQKEEEVAEKDLDVKTIGEVTEVANANPTVINGVGLVIGLEGTGGGAPPGPNRTLLENELKKKGVKNVKQLINSDNNAVVIVTAVIPPGAHKGDRLDVQVALPPGSKARSLRGGILTECVLRNFDTTKNLNPGYDGANRWLPGHILAKAKGPLLVGFGDGDEAAKERVARIWGGAISLIDRPFFLTLKNDQQFARVANAVADRINQTFHDDARKRLMVLGQVTDRLNKLSGDPANGNTAKAMNREVVYVRVPWVYRLNSPRYLRVARLVPLQDVPGIHNRYRRKWEKKLLSPKTTLQAALRLEALGQESIAALKTGLKSDHLLVRFCAAESLCYLGSTAGAEELVSLVKLQPRLRAYGLTALTALNESVCRVRLGELLANSSIETRYGSFRALWTMDERDSQIAGDLLNDCFWLHRLAPNSPGLVHMSSSKRPEIILFGQTPTLVPPCSIVAGEFTITASPNDDKCTVSRFAMHNKSIERKQCSLKLEEVLRVMADQGATYCDAHNFLYHAQRSQCLTCPVAIDALPQSPDVEVLAANADNPDYWKTDPGEESRFANRPAKAEETREGEKSGAAGKGSK